MPMNSTQTNSPHLSMNIRGVTLLIITLLLWASAFAGIRSGLQSYAPGALDSLTFPDRLHCTHHLCTHSATPSTRSTRRTSIIAPGLLWYHRLSSRPHIWRTDRTGRDSKFFNFRGPLLHSAICTVFLKRSPWSLGMVRSFYQFCGRHDYLF